MLKCNACGYYCHIRCSRLLPQSDAFESDEENQEDFKCLECLLTGKSINHLIRETCENYENIHQILARHRLLSYLCGEILNEYFPIPEKAPLFIKAFIQQNQDFFKHDPEINDWLSLLETGVCYQSEESTAAGEKSVDKHEATESQAPKTDAIMESEEGKNEGKKSNDEWNQYNFQEVYNTTVHADISKQEKTEAEIAYDRMYGYKETFLPEKRNLYEALDSEKGYHRFGQREHFIDPFSPET